ncbi:MAG TPA: hypothetical protein VGC25_08270 [Alphaproteobacteria bacterium]
MRLAILLLLLCGALAAAVADRIGAAPKWIPQAAPPETGAAPAPEAPFAAPPRIEFPSPADVADIAERNLFSPGRRPLVAEAAPAKETPLRQTGGIELKGVVITPAGRAALIKTRKDADYVRVEAGQTVDGWIVESIGSDSVVLRDGATSRTVTLESSAPDPAPARPEPRTRRAPRAAPQR